MSGAPPDFAAGATLRQRARAAGMNPDYWYAVEEVRRVKPGTVVEVVFWRRSIALFRADDGSFRAVENRCAHRQLKLSLGEVRGCRLVCAYHGWQYDGDGRCVEIPHERYGRGFPRAHPANLPGAGSLRPGLAVSGRPREGEGTLDTRHPRTRGPRAVGLRAAGLRLVRPPLDGDRQRERLLTCPPASSIPPRSKTPG